jgi:hypothetical protein
MSFPIGSAVRRPDGVLGKVVRGHRRAPRGMCWVLWDDRTTAVLWQRWPVSYVARRYSTAVQWEQAGGSA